MIVATQKSSRIAAFKRVLMDATKPPPLSPAFAVYHAATSDAERRAAYALLTESDREAIIADARKSLDVRMRALADEHCAKDAVFKARSDIRETAIKLAKESQIAALPPAVRRRVEWGRLIVRIACVTGTCLVVTFLAAQLIGEVGYFVGSLFHDWVAWAILVGANVVIFTVVFFAAYWRIIFLVVRAIPSAIYAAITARRKKC